jgi:hypothetical protein
LDGNVSLSQDFRFSERRIRKRSHYQVRPSNTLAPHPAHYRQAELSAAATIINYWNPGVSNAVWITMCLVVAVGINMSGVGKCSSFLFFSPVKLNLLPTGVYGEAEFIFW